MCVFTPHPPVQRTNQPTIRDVRRPNRIPSTSSASKLTCTAKPGSQTLHTYSKQLKSEPRALNARSNSDSIIATRCIAKAEKKCLHLHHMFGMIIANDLFVERRAGCFRGGCSVVQQNATLQKQPAAPLFI